MRNSIIFICLILNLAQAQQIKIEGKVIDKETNEPIYGVAIISEDNYLTFSDVDGLYSFEILPNDNIIISFKHLAYTEQHFTIDKIVNRKEVTLVEKLNNLDEVVIVNNIKKTLEEYIDVSVKKFEDDYVQHPYWSGLDYKHVLHLNGTPHAFLHMKGNILMVGSKNNNPFIDASVIPDQIRRTKEDEEFLKALIKNQNTKNQVLTQYGGSETRGTWTDFRFVELIHPLSNKGKRHFTYSFDINSRDSSEVIINFKQKKGISLGTRWLDKMSGQIWIDKNDLNVKRLITTYRFERIQLIGYDISYKYIDEVLYPSIVSKRKYFFNSYDETKSKITITSVSHLKNIDTKKRKNYRKNYMSPWYTFSEVYHNEYWKDIEIEEFKYRNALGVILNGRPANEVFMEGANTKEYNSKFPENIRLDWEKKGLELKKIMLNDLNE